MSYYAKLMGHRCLTTAEGANDADAIERCLADSVTMRSANPSQVVVAVYYRYENEDVLIYATTLSKYRAGVA